MRLLILLLLLPFVGLGQHVDPEPPSGVDKFVEYLNVNFPAQRTDSEKKLQGEIVLELRISESGKVDSIHIVKNVGENGALDLIKVIKKAGDWTAGKEDGKDVAKWVRFPYAIPGMSVIDKSSKITGAKPVDGDAEFDLKFYKNFRYPEKALNAGIQGDFELSFDIKANGEPTNIKLEDDPGYELADAAIRALRRAGKWVPAKDADGKDLNYRTTYKFTLSIKEFRTRIF